MADSTMSSLKGTFVPREPMEEEGSGIWFQPLPGALERGGGPTVRPEACSLPRDPPGGEDCSAETEAGPLPEIHMGEEGPGIELGAQPLPPMDKGLP